MEASPPQGTRYFFYGSCRLIQDSGNTLRLAPNLLEAPLLGCLAPTFSAIQTSYSPIKPYESRSIEYQSQLSYNALQESIPCFSHCDNFRRTIRASNRSDRISHSNRATSKLECGTQNRSFSKSARFRDRATARYS